MKKAPYLGAFSFLAPTDSAQARAACSAHGPVWWNLASHTFPWNTVTLTPPWACSTWYVLGSGAGP